jgi:hypothetical protein
MTNDSKPLPGFEPGTYGLRNRGPAQAISRGSAISCLERATAKRPLARSGWVYFARCSVTGLVKIGASRAPKRRLADLQRATPSRLVLEAKLYSRHAFSLESALHFRFRDAREIGEWFRLTDVDVARLVNEHRPPVVQELRMELPGRGLCRVPRLSGEPWPADIVPDARDLDRSNGAFGDWAFDRW